MPYWVEQRTGSHVGRISEIVAAAKAGAITDREAWQELAELYKVVHGHYPGAPNGREAPPDESYELHRDGYGADVAYMLTSWFPLYANLWFEGTREECQAKVRELERLLPGTRFEVCYEY